MSSGSRPATAWSVEQDFAVAKMLVDPSLVVADPTGASFGRLGGHLQLKTLASKSIAHHIFLQFLEPGCSLRAVSLIVQA